MATHASHKAHRTHAEEAEDDPEPGMLPVDPDDGAPSPLNPVPTEHDHNPDPEV